MDEWNIKQQPQRFHMVYVYAHPTQVVRGLVRPLFVAGLGCVGSEHTPRRCCLPCYMPECGLLGEIVCWDPRFGKRFFYSSRDLGEACRMCCLDLCPCTTVVSWLRFGGQDPSYPILVEKTKLWIVPYPYHAEIYLRDNRQRARRGRYTLSSAI